MANLGWVSERTIWIRNDNTGRINVDSLVDNVVKARICDPAVDAEIRYDLPGCIEVIVAAGEVNYGVAKFTIPKETLPRGWVNLRVVTKDVGGNIVNRALKHSIRVE